MKYLIGVDIGTTATKTVLFDCDGNAVSSHTSEYPLYQEKIGYAEQSPDDWATAAIEGIIRVTECIVKSDVVAIGLAGQMHGLVMLGDKGEVLRKSIIWCDQRSDLQAQYINDVIGRDKMIELTANPAVAGFTASKILWVQQNEADIWRQCRHILLPKDYVRFALTDIIATDVSDASGTGLLDVANRQYSREVCGKLNIPLDYLPQVFESSDVVGAISSTISRLTGLSEDTVVVGGAGDQAAAAIGNGIVRQGIISDTLGTSGVVFATTDRPLVDSQGRVHTFCHAVKGKWHIMGVTQACGMSMKWLKDNICPTLNYDTMNELARTVEPGCDNLYFLPYLMGERCPHMNSQARGMLFGLTNTHNTSHIIRSVFEGISYSQLDCLRIIRELGLDSYQVRVGGGGAKSALWREILADMFLCDIAQVDVKENGALGAAILAGVGAGIYDSVESACDKLISVASIQRGIGADYSKGYEIYKKLYSATKMLLLS